MHFIPLKHLGFVDLPTKKVYSFFDLLQHLNTTKQLFSNLLPTHFSSLNFTFVKGLDCKICQPHGIIGVIFIISP